MSETYLITAKTVEEAIAIANREYADQDHEVSYEILEMPKKGFLGIGAKDAKIKITVTKSVSAELDSLVSDIRGMKVMTTRGGEGKKPSKPRNGEQKQNQQRADKPQQNQQKADKPAQQKQNNQNQPKQNQPKAEKPQQNQPKQNNQQKAEKPQGEQKQNQQKADKPQQNQQKQNNQPKAEKPQQNNQKQQKPVEKAPVKAEEPVQAPAEEVKSDIASKLDAAISSATTVDVTPKFGDVNAEYKSSLRNQAKPNRRAPQKASSGSGEKLGGGVTVSAPVGLTDFSASEKTGFGYGESSAGGRISNDIRKGKKKNGPKPAETPAEKPAESVEVKASENAESVQENRTDARPEGEGKSRNRRRRDRKKGERTRNENAESVNESAETVSAPSEPAEPKKREPITQAEMDYALEFINTLLKNMGLGASGVPAECPEGEEFEPTEEAPVYPRINIVGDDTGILIGHHGETLDAIQYLVNLSALRKSKSKDGDYIKIVVDIENYREKREETLRQLARRMAARAVKYRRNVFLEPMNAYERRIIHSELQSFENVSTHSVGADRDRKIIITYEGPDKAPEKPRRRRGDKKPADVEMTAEVAEITYNNPEDYSAEEDNASEVMEALEQAAVLVTDENTTGAGDGENRRPKKVQKMPIEKFTELLAASDNEPDEKPAFED